MVKFDCLTPWGWWMTYLTALEAAMTYRREDGAVGMYGWKVAHGWHPRRAA